MLNEVFQQTKVFSLGFPKQEPFSTVSINISRSCWGDAGGSMVV